MAIGCIVLNQKIVELWSSTLNTPWEGYLRVGQKKLEFVQWSALGMVDKVEAFFGIRDYSLQNIASFINKNHVPVTAEYNEYINRKNASPLRRLLPFLRIEIAKIQTVSLCALLGQKDQARAYPSPGAMDTMVGLGQYRDEIHAEFFSDEDIVRKEKIQREEFGNYNILVRYTTHGKAIIQQQTLRGCTAAAAAMLIKDCGGEPNWDNLRFTDLGGSSTMSQAIQMAGLLPIITTLSERDLLSSLRELIHITGSAIVDVTPASLGGHVVVVDEISEDLESARLRDPYHGWEITVKASAFIAALPDPKVLQVKRR